MKLVQLRLSEKNRHKWWWTGTNSNLSPLKNNLGITETSFLLKNTTFLFDELNNRSHLFDHSSKTSKSWFNFCSISNTLYDDCWSLFVCLFVCFGFIVPLDNFPLIRRRHHCRWKAANFDLWSAFIAFDQWGFFSVPNLLWHGASVYNGHLRVPVTLTPIAERLPVELSLPGLPRLGFQHATFRLRGERSNPLRHRRGELSSANNLHIVSMFFSNIIYINRNNNGPKTEPWGTPEKMSNCDDNWSLYITFCDLWPK